jgi:microcystin-dependent protein
MVEPFLAEIRVFSFGFAPKGWAFCDGQLLPIIALQGVFPPRG